MSHEHGTVEKIICCDRDSNDNLATALLAGGYGRKDNDAFATAAMMGGMNNQWNNPFVYLVWMMFAQRMWGNNGWDGVGTGQAAQNIEIQNQLEALRSQMQENQNTNALMDAIKGNGCDLKALASQLNCDFNSLSAAICDVRMGIAKLSGEIGFSAERVINAVNLGNCNIIEQLKDCCCTTHKLILEQGYQSQLATQAQTNTLQRGQDFINRSIERGFAAQGYQAQQDKCDILRAGENNTQRIIDTLNAHWKDEQANQIQDLKFQLSQERQNRLLLSRLGGNCGNNCGNNCGGCGSCF